MKKNRFIKLTALFLSVVLLSFSLSGCLMFETLMSLVGGRPAPVNFNSIKYYDYDLTYFDALYKDITDMLDKLDSPNKVLSSFSKLHNEAEELFKLYSVTSIYSSLDTLSEEYNNNYLSTYEKTMYAQDKLNTLGNIIAHSYCAGDAKQLFGEETFAMYAEYVPYSEEQLALLQREQEYIAKYNAGASAEYTVEINGKAINFNNIYTSGLSEAETVQAMSELYKQKNKALTEIYIDLMGIRAEITAANSYASYADYCYAESFLRDYTVEDIAKVYDDVKTYLVPLSESLNSSISEEDYSALFSRGSDEKYLLNTVAPKIAAIDDDMKASLSFMKKYDFYDFSSSPAKLNGAFTTLVYYYYTPYMFINSTGSCLDVFTFIHEFGHFNAMYNYPYAATDMDTSEIHSTGLELLSTAHFPELFGKSADTATKYLVADTVDTIITGCMINEFEYQVYKNNITDTEALNKLMMELYREYGLVDQSDTRTELYSWVDIPHLFMYPFYYISYSVSSLSSLDLWASSLENYSVALNSYKLIVAADGTKTFRENAEAADLGTIFDENIIKELSEKITEAFNK